MEQESAPLVGTSVFLSAPGTTEISEGLRELTSVAGAEEYEGKRREWDKIVQGELEKAAEVQDESTALRHREVEQAVVATFLHSQPIGQKTPTRDSTVLIVPSRDGLEAARNQIRDHLGWVEVQSQLKEQEKTPPGRRGCRGTSTRPGTGSPMPCASHCIRK